MLLRAALQDPLNQNFMLLSDSDAPLYPASLVYQQLIQAGFRADFVHRYPISLDPAEKRVALGRSVSGAIPIDCDRQVRKWRIEALNCDNCIRMGSRQTQTSRSFFIIELFVRFCESGVI